MGWCLQSTKRKEFQPQILYPGNPPSRKGEIKTFWDEQKIREVIMCRPDLQGVLRGVLKALMKEHWTLNQNHMKKEFW